MPTALMHLRVLLPFQLFADVGGLSRLVAETPSGFFGILPHRRDCVAALVPGILTYETDAAGEVFVALDEGVLVKTGQEVLVSVRRAMSGNDLDELRAAVERDFLKQDDDERSLRSVAAKLESGFLHRLASFRHE